MSLQQYLNNDVLATISETVSGTLTTINVFAVPMVMAKSGDVVFIINKGTGRQYQVTLTADLDTSLNRITFSSTTFDTPIPEGSIVIQKQLTKYTNLFRKYTTVNIPLVVSNNTLFNDLLRDDNVTASFNIDSGAALADGDTVDARTATLHSSFLTPSNGAKIENVKYTVNTTAASGRSCEIKLFQVPIGVDTTSSQTISLINSQSVSNTPSVADPSYNFFFNTDINYNLSANTSVMATFKAVRGANSADTWVAQIEILISYDPR